MIKKKALFIIFKGLSMKQITHFKSDFKLQLLFCACKIFEKHLPKSNVLSKYAYKQVTSLLKISLFDR